MASRPHVRRVVQLFACPLLIAWTGACAGSGDERPVLTADMPLHLEDHLDAATIEGSEPPTDPPHAVEWRFDEPQPDWKVARPAAGGYSEADLTRTSDGLRVSLPGGRRNPNGLIAGGMYIDLPDWRRDEWGEVLVRARTGDAVVNMSLLLNPQEAAIRETMAPLQQVFQIYGGVTPIVSDGSVQTYRIALNWGGDGPGAWRRVGLGFGAREPASIDILSVSVVPTAALYADEATGVRSVAVGDDLLRRTLHTHAPGRVAYSVRVPERGRLDVALGVLKGDASIEFRIVAEPRGGEPTTLLRETYADDLAWAERSVDLSRFAEQTVTLALETDSEESDTVAFWGAPTVSGARATDKPNVIFYIIDGAGADYMSVYGYNRRTTPNLERLVAEGAVFERAYSNASWTLASTASFLTSLQHSVLGGLRDGRNPVPEQVSTIAEHLHRAGYQTAELTSNPNAGRISNLDRGHDVFRDIGVRPHHSVSSVALHEEFSRWRAAYPGEPYYVHFQTTDVHDENLPVAPFAGLFIGPARRAQFDAWNERMAVGSGGISKDIVSTVFSETGISRTEYVTAARDLYDETMAHQDYQLGRLVARLKAQGEWDRTLLIVAADHGPHAGAMDFGALMREPAPATEGAADPSAAALAEGGYAAAMLASGVSHVPLIVVWPERIAPGKRFSDPVSMVDMLPTILDLADLPMPEVMQGQSLAPLLLGEPGWEPRPVILDELRWEPRPVILDELRVDNETREMWGRIEVVDGRWGASLQIVPPGGEDRRTWVFGAARPASLLLYDLWTDPMCLHSLHEEHPDLVEKYTKFLEDQWAAHQALATHFTPGPKVALTPEQLEALRALGYIR